MVEFRSWFTTEEVLKFFLGDESANEDDLDKEDSLAEYDGTTAADISTDADNDSEGSCSDEGSEPSNEFLTAGNVTTADDQLDMELGQFVSQVDIELDLSEPQDSEIQVSTKSAEQSTFLDKSVYLWESSDNEESTGSESNVSNEESNVTEFAKRDHFEAM